jgi:hypothetical protein
MPKLRNKNDSIHPVLDEYLYCEIKSNKPRIHHRVCEERCRRLKKCPYYGEWYREYYDKELEEKPKPKRKKVVRRPKKKAKKKKLKVKAVSA